MSWKTFFAVTLGLLAVFGCASPLLAQDPDFSLTRAVTDSTLIEQQQAELEAERFVPGIYAGKLEAALSLGFMSLNTTLLADEQLLYKFTDEATYWGDVELIGEAAFSPMLRLDYTLTSWLAIEAIGLFTVSEYQARITNRFSRANEDDATIEPNPPLEEYDAEHRSVVTLGGGLGAVLYPFNIFKGGKGRWHPFVTAGAGGAVFDMNSDYTKEPASNVSYYGSGGIRFVADDLISVQFQIGMQSTNIQFTPSDAWETFNEGTVNIPVYKVENGQAVVVTEFDSQQIDSFFWAIGFTAVF